MHRNKVPQEEKDLILKLYKEGMSYRDITNQTGNNAMTISKIVKGMRGLSEANILARKQGKCKITESGRIALSQNGIKSCQKTGKFWTKPEQEFSLILLSMNIGVKVPDYIAEITGFKGENDGEIFYQYPIQRYVVDFVDVKRKIAINVNGDYWHANPMLYDEDKLGDLQKTNIRQDKNKKIFLEKNGWKILDIWESEIYWNKSLVIEKIRAVGIEGTHMVYTHESGVQISHCPPPEDWSEKLKHLWFKKARKARTYLVKIKRECQNPKCKKEFEVKLRKNRERKYCCLKCSASMQRRSAVISKEELQKLINEKPMVQIGKMFGVSDNAVRKWAKKYGIL